MQFYVIYFFKINNYNACLMSNVMYQITEFHSVKNHTQRNKICCALINSLI